MDVFSAYLSNPDANPSQRTASIMNDAMKVLDVSYNPRSSADKKDIEDLEKEFEGFKRALISDYRDVKKQKMEKEYGNSFGELEVKQSGWVLQEV